MKNLGLILFTCLIMNFSRAQNTENLVTSNTAFALDLYQQLAKSNANKNFFISPYSISEALALCFEGASNNTENQIKEVLHFSENQSDIHTEFKDLKFALFNNTDSVTFTIANSMWPQNGFSFNSTYTNRIESDYKAPINYVNYKKKSSRKKAVIEINNWVNNNTDHQINQLITEDDLSEDSRLLLINAIWFYGEWNTEFNAKYTKEGVFKSSEQEEQKTMFMSNKGNYLYYEDDIVSAIQIPYKGNKQSLIIMLPIKNDGIKDLEKNFAIDYTSSIIDDMRNIELRIKIPKFSTEYNIDLKEILKDMGIVEAFNDIADFSKMRKENDLKIDKILHKAKVEISEKGTKAAAATSVNMIRKTSAIDETVFVADHPFIYMVRDTDTGSILFLGKMAMVEEHQ